MNKAFPMIDGPPIEWEEAEKIYKIYYCLFGNIQSLEEIAKRGGFRYSEVEYMKKEYENKKCSCNKNL
jgi:hypothetical protein